jgi:integrase
MYCRNTLRGMRASLGRVLSWAVKHEWLEKNPCSGVKLPQAGERVVRTILTPAQVSDIARKLKDPYATLILFLAVTGLRIGEAVGIKRSDFDGDILRVRRRIYEGRADTTKTKKSARDLPIPDALRSRLFSISGREWIFESTNTTPINPGNALKRYVRPALRLLEIQDRRLARLQAHARNHAAQTRMVRESQGRHSGAFKLAGYERCVRPFGSSRFPRSTRANRI